MYIIFPPARRINRRRTDARRRRAITHAAQIAALLVAAYGLAYLITTAVMI